jgi:potassium efflux system protein
MRWLYPKRADVDRPRIVLATLWAVGGLILACLVVPSTGAVEENPAEAVAVSRTKTAADIEVRRAKLTDEITELQAALVELDEASLAAQSVRAELATLERIDGLLLRLTEQILLGADLERGRLELSERIATGLEAAIGDPPPYALSRIDALDDASRVASAREADRNEMIGMVEKGLEQALAELAQSKRARRDLLAAESDASLPSDVEEIARLLLLNSLVIRLAETQRDLSRSVLDNANADLALHQLQAEIGAEALDFARAHLEFDVADREAAMDQFEERGIEAREALDQAKVALDAAERRLGEVQAAEVNAESTAKLEARRLARQAAQRRVAQIDIELERLPQLAGLVDHRHRVLAGEAARSEVIVWEGEAEQFITDLERQRRLAQGRFELLSRRRRETLDLAAATPNPGVAHWVQEQASEIERLVVLYQSQLSDLGQSRSLVERARADFLRHSSSVALRDLFDSVALAVRDGWDTELIVVDDRSVTTGKVVSAFVLFVLGFIASRFASRFLRRLLARTSVDVGAALAFEGLSFYLLLTLFFLLALRTVGIPLTAFTVLGGGVAIGVGFGSQNVINNFISGLILMIERPIKVGDIVEVDGTFGQVEQIGARSTRVKTFDNIHIIVPNSAFLEKNVVNWTLSDNLVRTHVDVGVAYGSPTRDVDRLIHRALADHGKVLNQPDPIVLFTEFGDNALNFRAVFWLHMRLMMDRRKIESDVRFRIDRLFREAGIAIAFPQRDVHLDTTSPLEVRFASPDPDEPSV